MGNNSRGSSGIEQEINFLQNNYNGFLLPLPPPPLLMQQVPVIFVQRSGMMEQPQVQNGHVETKVYERLKSVRITWNHEATNVSVAGSWNNWETVETLQNVGQHFVIVKTLPVNIYRYRFIVDGYWTHAPEFPLDLDNPGYNILDLQDYIQQQVESFDSEVPPSPPSSYDNMFLNEDDFSKAPPELPPQLPVTILERSDSTPSFTHVELNHLYLLPKSNEEQFAVLQSTHRFQHKFVTTVLYKSLSQ